jgi:ADP-ribose pyrophosphatase
VRLRGGKLAAPGHAAPLHFLIHVGDALDEDEFLEVMTVPLAEALAWVREGRITEAKAVTGLLWAEKIRSGEW